MANPLCWPPPDGPPNLPPAAISLYKILFAAYFLGIIWGIIIAIAVVHCFLSSKSANSSIVEPVEQQANHSLFDLEAQASPPLVPSQGIQLSRGAETAALDPTVMETAALFVGYFLGGVIGIIIGIFIYHCLYASKLTEITSDSTSAEHLEAQAAPAARSSHPLNLDLEAQAACSSHPSNLDLEAQAAPASVPRWVIHQLEQKKHCPHLIRCDYDIVNHKMFPVYSDNVDVDPKAQAAPAPVLRRVIRPLEPKMHFPHLIRCDYDIVNHKMLPVYDDDDDDDDA